MINLVKQYIDQADKIVFLTGAGISVASGIPDYAKRNREKVNGMRTEWLLSIDYFESMSTRDLFWQHFKEIFDLNQLNHYEPNPNHRFIFQLEGKGKDVTVITQNIDGLHQKSGSSKVYELHGNLSTVYCPQCRYVYPMEEAIKQHIPVCETCKKMLKPSIVLYDEDIQDYESALQAVLDADLLIVMGTSLKVAPANLFPIEAKYNSNQSPLYKSVLLNQTPTAHDHHFDLVVHKPLEEIIPLL